MDKRGTRDRVAPWAALVAFVLVLPLLNCQADQGNNYNVQPPAFTGGAGAGLTGAAGSALGGQAGTSFGRGGGPSVMNGIAGASGNGVGAAGMAGLGGLAGRGGMGGAGGAGRGGASGAGMGGASGHGGMGGAGASGAGAGGGGGNQETGMLAGITAAHNAVRAMVQTTPMLQPLTWSPTLAAYAQQWADMQGTKPCNQAQHRSGQELQQKRYGENLAAGSLSTAQQAVNGWAGEVSCWTYGTVLGTEQCNTTCYQQMHSDGCGHYTAIVWRTTTEVGCGVAACSSAGGFPGYVWICNYSPPGNIVGMAPY
jgi:pathogenesis-related protein 1